jgi:hypothetical protein
VSCNGRKEKSSKEACEEESRSEEEKVGSPLLH